MPIDMNQEAREAMNRWRTRQKNAQRRIINFEERVSARLDAIRERMVTRRHALMEWEIREVYYRDVGDYIWIDDDWRTIRVGQTWGGPDVSAFFRRPVTIPDEMHGQRVYLRLYVGGDSLLRLDGIPYHGLDPFRDTVLLTREAQGGHTYRVELESYIFWYPAEGDYNTFQQAELVTIDAELDEAYWDFVAAFKVLFIRDINASLKQFLETHLWDGLRDLPVDEPNWDIFKAAVRESREYLRRNVFETHRFKMSGKLYMVGHSHLDIVYQWAHREYIRKIGRTHATMLRMIEQYPQFKFSQSSAKIYADMKEHYPHMYAEVKQRIAEGRWQPVGAFWLEPDCNLISGESFVRHILHGQRFWREEFGFTSRVCWQPDVFGMSWTLPQILKRSGIDVVLTNKLFVWNDTNQWTQNNFWWEAADGSRVLAVIPPGHFIGFVDPDHMDTYWKNFSDKNTVGETIYTYGWGDGGGGVDPEMIECATRYQDFPGMVPSEFANPEDALLRIAEQAAQSDLPVWRDELYLETHRGTYTSKGWLKQHNRQSEILLRQVEMLATLAWVQGADYPADALDAVWKILLYTQFHDALPGTHITRVYHELLESYQQLHKRAGTIHQAACQALFGPIGDQVLVFNPSLHPVGVLIEVPSDVLADRAIDGAVQQAITHLDGRESVLVQLAEPLPSVGYRVLATGKAATATEAKLSVSETVLENRYLRVEFAYNGEMIRLYDKELGREVLVAGEHGNRFQLYEDKPGRYDAWDIVASYVEHELSMDGTHTLEVHERGPLQASLKLTRTFMRSTITQIIALRADERQLRFETQVDWQERQRLLKVGFPVAINAHQATYDIAYGTIQRATHRNTAHDQARFEVPAHRWMDVSEFGYGVALLNNSKYGHEANRHWMRLTLLKGSISPDPQADLGTHHFTYVLYPHKGGWRNGDVNAVAAALNEPLSVQPTAIEPGERSFIRCDARNVTLEAVKQSEDGQRVVVRLVERHNQWTRTQVRLPWSVRHVFKGDLMENAEEELDTDGDRVTVPLNPCEIVTLLIEV